MTKTRVRQNDDVTVVVPMFNESLVIGEVVKGLCKVFDHVVCIDDGSTDTSSQAALEAGALVLRHPVNLGQGAALRTGLDWVLAHSNSRWIVTFDADGQHSPHDALRMLARARLEDVDVVLGSRFGAESDHMRIPRARLLVLRGAVLFTRLTTGLRVSDAHNGLRVLSRTAAQLMRLEQAGMAHASEVLAIIRRHRLSYVEEPVLIQYSVYSMSKGQSNLNAVNVIHDLCIARLRTVR